MSPWSSGEFWGLWELEERHTLVLSRPKILIGRLPSKLCRPGRVKCKLESSCSPPWQTRLLVGYRRQRTDWLRFLEEASILSDLDCWVETGHLRLHSGLREGGLEWAESQIGPEDEGVPEFCWTEIWNESLPACVCRLLQYCCHSTLELSDCTTEAPTEEQLICCLLAPASWCAERSPEETTVLRGDDLANWLPILSGMHPWRRTGWVPVDAKAHRAELPVCWTNAGEREILYPVGVECPKIACIESNVSLSRTERTWWIKGLKCEIRLVMDEILGAGMAVDVDRWDRTLVRESKNESGGEMKALWDWNVDPRSIGCLRDLA